MYIKSFLIAISFSLIFGACMSETETIEVKNEAGQVVEKYERKKSNFAKHGLYQMFDDAGNLIESAHYVNDTLDGKRTLFFENGKPQYIENWVHGKFEGEYKSFYESGQLKMLANYHDNMMQGESKVYYKNGTLKEVVHFVNNEENGPFVEYHENGKLAAEGSYLEGDHEHGELKLYNDGGILVKIMDCDRGICHTRWKKEDSK